MKSPLMIAAFIFFAAAGPASACTSDATCESRPPGDGRRAVEPMAPARPDGKLACATDDACSRPGVGRRHAEGTGDVRRRMACGTDNCGRPDDGRRHDERAADRRWRLACASSDGCDIKRPEPRGEEPKFEPRKAA